MILNALAAFMKRPPKFKSGQFVRRSSFKSSWPRHSVIRTSTQTYGSNKLVRRKTSKRVNTGPKWRMRQFAKVMGGFLMRQSRRPGFARRLLG